MAMAKYQTQTPFIASYVIIRKEGKIAFLMRSNTQWMNGNYSLPSGKVEKDESISQAAVREAFEELGVRIKPQDLRFAHMMHRHMETDWISTFFEVVDYEGEVVNAEPGSHAELAWFDPKNLPDKVLEYIRQAIGNIESGIRYSEYQWKK
jgi:8-oxo-dGTP diphosphatase